ncbi:uncharacterized protein LOC129775696 [Toxorhynchites rutilus septentrionalis]|uniref:uncharacterized protein LOC129775696 n=1 Tax=Toxorhynchites rutilus septentrionalis TaxID=329112 RepID=UPI00247A36F9|nr:uncharacterized protein LOC129775696 [Toxorhynchites rutilus septentrionalis]
MPFCLRILRSVGLWENRKYFYRFVFACFWIGCIILFPKAVFGMGSNRFDSMAKGWSEFIYQANLVGAAVIFAAKGTCFKQLIELLARIIDEATDNDLTGNCYKEIRRQNGQIDKFAKFYGIYCCICPMLFSISSIITTNIQYFTADRNSSEELKFEIPMEQKFYGMHVRTNYLHYNIFLAISMTSYYCCAFVSVVKVSTMIIMVKYCSLAFRLVAIQVQDLSQLPQNTPKTPKLIRIVNLHNNAFEVTDLAEEILCFPVMMQFMSTVLFWCTTMLYMSTNLDYTLLNVLVIFFLSMIETYGYSYLGSQLTDEAAAVGAAIYDLPWYNEPPELQRQYRLVLQRSQLETGITAAKFFIVGIDKFGSLAQMSYSYYLVLKDTLTMRIENGMMQD